MIFRIRRWIEIFSEWYQNLHNWFVTVVLGRDGVYRYRSITVYVVRVSSIE